MMKFLTSVMFSLFGFQLQAQSYFETSLQQGPYKVGFKAGVHYDYGRPPIMGQNSHLTGRAVYISVWYPSTTSHKQSAMKYHEYVSEISQMINPEEVTKSILEASVYQMNELLAQLGGDSVLFNIHLDQILNTSTKAYRNADIDSGSFPVLIYPESPHQNNILSEYLASHGYIVVSVSRHGTLTTDFEWQNVRGIETLVQDCQFALSIVRKEFKSAGKELAVLGTGMNASAGLAWMMRNPMIGALVSLEGGILTNYEYSLIQKSPYFDVRAVTSPMLMMHSPHEFIDPGLSKHYKYADRYVVHLPFMSEYHYLNFGVWEKSIPGILGPAPGDTKLGFEWMARYTLAFLDWKLKMLESERKFFASPLEANGVPEGLMEMDVLYASEVPLSEAELLTLKATDGFDKMLAEVERSVRLDTAAFDFPMYVSMGGKLLVEKEYTNALQWSELFIMIFPTAVNAYTMAARSYVGLEDKENAHVMYSYALSLLESDPFIEPSDKNLWREIIEQRIQQLGE